MYRIRVTCQLKILRPLLLSILVLGPSCSRVPPLHPYDEATNNQYLTAPLIAVGVVEGDELVGGPVPSPPSSRSPSPSPLQLHKVSVHVENVLKGAIPERTITVYYFTFKYLTFGGRFLIFHRDPLRRVLWLRKDSGVYRTACDWQNCTVWITSGAHPDYRPDPGASINQILVDLTMTRGQGPVDNHQFAAELFQYDERPGLFAYTIEKLRYLALTESSEVKTKACEDLWIYGHDKIDDRLRERALDSVRVAGCNCQDGATGVDCQTK